MHTLPLEVVYSLSLMPTLVSILWMNTDALELLIVPIFLPFRSESLEMFLRLSATMRYETSQIM